MRLVGAPRPAHSPDGMPGHATLVPFVVALAMACGGPSGERADQVVPTPLASATAATVVPPSRASDTAPPEPAALRRAVTIAATGDLVLNTLVMSAVRRAPTEADGYRTLLSAYAPLLSDGEIAYLNLETSLVDDVVPLDGGWPRSRTERPRRAPVLGSTAALAAVLSEIGFDVVGLANNHAFDQDHTGLRRTRALALAAGLAAPGAGETAEEALEAAVIERDGVRVGFVSLTTSLNRRAADVPRIFVGRHEPVASLESALRSARARSDVVVVLVHWSTDFVMSADGEERRVARVLVEAGADIVLGTGPHVLHEVVRIPSARGEALVAYSLGNAASGMGRGYRLGHPPHDYVHPANVVPEARDGVLLHIRVEISPEGRVSIGAVEGTPLWTENDYREAGAAAVARLVSLADAAPEVCRERLPIVRRALGGEVTLELVCE